MAVVEDVLVDTIGRDPVLLGFVGGSVIALLNLIGASVVLVWQNPTEKWFNAALGFAAGVMLSASSTNLLLPGIEFALEADHRALGVGGLELVGIMQVSSVFPRNSGARPGRTLSPIRRTDHQ